MKALLTAFALASVAAAEAQPRHRPTRFDAGQDRIAQHDGVTLAGDLIRQRPDKAPLVIAVHGGGWQVGGPVTYRHWGAFLAKHGFAVFAISYRLSKPGAKTFPGRSMMSKPRSSSRAPTPRGRHRSRSHRADGRFGGAHI